MIFWEILLLAVALAMDAFAVAVGAGCLLRTPTVGHGVRLAAAFGLFQFFMPVLGWSLGLTVRPFIESWDHWIAFGLLAWIGGGMIRESLQSPRTAACPGQDPTRGKNLLLLAVATSIDALAVGLSFSLLHVPVWGAAALIGIVCAVLTGAGFTLGICLARAARLGAWAELVGGIVLVLIGLKILAEHGVFA